MEMRSRSYIGGLDVARFFLLFLGMITHAFAIGTVIAPEAKFLSLPPETTFMFRMEAFFLISGYLSALTLQDARAWISKRVKRLGVPFLFTVLVINVATMAINPQVYPDGPDIYMLHAWFLAVLLLHSVLLWVSAGRIDALIPRLTRYLTSINVAPILIGALVLYELAVKTVYKYAHWEDGPRPPLHNLLDSTLTYLPYYLLGYVLYKNALITNMLRDRRVSLILVAAIATASFIAVRVFVGNDGSLVTVALIALKATISFCVAVIILTVALSVGNVPPLVMFLSQGSYAVYIAHLFIVNLLYVIFFDPVNTSIYTFAAVCALLTPVIGYALYYWPIRHFAVLRLLFTGTAAKAGASRRASQQQAHG